MGGPREALKLARTTELARRFCVHGVNRLWRD